MRKAFKSVSIILSVLMIFQFILPEIGCAQINKNYISVTELSGNSKRAISKTGGNLLIADMDGSLPDTEPNTESNTIQSTTSSGIVIDETALPFNIEDTTPPTAPQSLSYDVISQNSIRLNWFPAADDSGIANYAVYRDDSMIATVTGSAIYLDSGLLPDTEYKYQVVAFDMAGNCSAKSDVLTAIIKSQVINAGNSIKVQMYNANRSAVNNTIFPWYKLYNTGSGPINLSDIKIRYYYTKNGDQSQNFWCDWSNIGSANVTGTFVNMPEKKKGADSYLEIGFKAGVINPGDSIEIQSRIAKNDWTNYDQTDDYSFNSKDTGYTNWDKVTAYSTDNLIWGIEPGTELPSDTIPPSVPLNLTSYSISDKEIELNWAASTDDVGVSGYIIYRNSMEIARVGEGTAYTDTGLLPDTLYTYEVAAYDFSNNISGKSSAISTKTGENINSALKVQLYNANRTEINNTIFPWYKIYNNGNVPINLENVKLRYYYTINGVEKQNFWCDWSNIGGSNVTGTFVNIPDKKNGADNYLEIGFKSGAGVINPGDSVEIQSRIAKINWTNYNQSDDYSFNITGTGYADWNKVTGYINGNLVCGIEPGTELPADITPPSVPSDLTSCSINDSEVQLSWTASTDDVGVSGYIIYRNGAEIARVGEGTAYTDTGLLPGTLYTYEVAAYDYSNNISEKSQAVSTKTGENISSALKVQLYNANRAEPNNTIFPWYKIYNSGNVPINLENVKLRYYYTINGEETQNFWCDWSSIGSSNVVGSFIKMPAVVEGVDYCLEISFKSGAGALKPGESAEIQSRIAKKSWTNYSQADDYSFNKSGNNYTDWNKVTGYIDGTLVWGIEPIAAPANVNVIPASKEITLNWDAVPCATSYEIEVDGTLMDNGISTTYTHTGLIPGTQHTYRVRAKNQIMQSPWSQYLTAITLLDKPSNVTREVTETRISLSWDAVEGAQSYDVEINGNIINNGTKTGYIMENLDEGTSHTVRIRAKGSAIDGEWIELGQIWTLPGIPQNIRTISSSKAITLIWDEVTGASGYEVEVSGTPVDNGSMTSYTHTGLEPNTQRIYRVRAKNPSGSGQWSNVIAATTLPGTAFNLQVTAEGSALKVSWDAQPGAISYELEIDGSQIIKLKETTYLHTGLAANSEHTYRVRAVNDDGSSSWSEVAKGVVLPFVPGNFRVVTVSSSAITLSWDEVKAAAGYDMEIDGEVVDAGTGTSYVHEGLNPNSGHAYRVRARNSNAAGAWTNEITQFTLLPSPANVKAAAAGNEIKLVWDMIIGAESYEVEVDGKILDAGINTEYVQADLTPGQSYTFRVRGINKNGQGDWSEPVTGKALLGVPANVCADPQRNSIIITWSEVEGATAYDVLVDGVIIDNGNSRVYQHINLTPNSLHVYMVRAKNAEYTGEWSDTVTAYTSVGIPANIKTFAASTEITITWDEVEGADSYSISADGKVVGNGLDTVYKHTGLEPNTEHTYKVRANSRDTYGPWSETVTQMTGPAVPGNFKADLRINEIALTWDKVEGAVSYEVEADGEIIKDILTENYLNQGLEPNTRHEYRVRVFNKEGACSEWSELLEVNTLEELTIKIDKDTGFNFIVAVPAKEGVDSYQITVKYNPDEVDVADLYANTQNQDLEPGKIEGTNLSILEFSEGRIVFGVDGTEKPVIAIIRFISKTNGEIRMSYTVE